MVIRPKTFDVSQPIVASMATPLVLHGRISIFNIFDVDTVGQMFRADAFFEIRLRGIALKDIKQQCVEEFLSAFDVPQGLVNFLHVVDITGEIEKWTEYKSSPIHPDTLNDYCLNYRIRASFSGQMVLHQFPFDQQELNIPLTVNMPQEFVSLHPNYHYPSVFQVTSFQLSNVFSVTTGSYVVATSSLSDISESSVGHVYPRMNFRVILQRQGGYYITNIILPISLITYLGFLSFAIMADGTRMDTNDRLVTSLTMVLTAVTYKFVVAGEIPQISYLTLLDRYVSFSFISVCLISVENALYPVYSKDFGLEQAVLWAMFGLYTTINILWALGVWYVLRQRERDNRKLLEQHRIRLLVTKTYPTSRNGFQGRMFAEMMKELGIHEAESAPRARAVVLKTGIPDILEEDHDHYVKHIKTVSRRIAETTG